MKARTGKFYKKIKWLVNGAIIGLIAGGLIGRSFNNLLIGLIIGISLAVIIKAVGWFRLRSLR